MLILLWVRDNYYKLEKMIPMRDGSKLFTAFYIPKDSLEKHPILFNRTPYTCWPYGEDKFNAHLYEILLDQLFKRRLYYCHTGCAWQVWMSEGEYVDIRPFNPAKKGIEFDEASDTYDAIDWMIKNIPYNNNRVGVFGISYPGFYSTMAALSNHPVIKSG